MGDPAGNFVRSVSFLLHPGSLTYPEETDLSSGPDLPLTSCATLGQSANLSKASFCINQVDNGSHIVTSL